MDDIFDIAGEPGEDKFSTEVEPKDLEDLLEKFENPPEDASPNWLGYNPPKIQADDPETRNVPKKIVDKLDIMRQVVECAAALGKTISATARMLGVSPTLIKSRFQEEMDGGKDRVAVKALIDLRLASDSGNVSASTFILKTIGGLKETTQLEVSGVDGMPLISQIERDQRILGMMTRNPAIAAMLEQKRSGNVVDITPENDDIFN